MKFHGTDPSKRPLRRNLYWLALGAALSLSSALGLSACISAGSCDDGCQDGAGGENAGGSAGGSGGGGENAGGSAGGAPSGPPADLAVANCTHDTIAKVETEVIVKGCGGTAACHGSPTSKTQTDLKKEGIAIRLLNAKPKGEACQNDLLIDPAAPEKSILLRKLEDMPTCNDGTQGGNKMPLSPLSGSTFGDDEKNCLTSYVNALSEWSKSQ